MEKNNKMEKEQVDSQVVNELKQSLGLLQTSTGIFYLVLSILYWIFFFSLITFLVGMLEDGKYLFLVYILDGIVIYNTAIGTLNIIFGIMIIKNYVINEKLEKALKLNSKLTLILFPIGTISGLIILKNFEELAC